MIIRYLFYRILLEGTTMNYEHREHHKTEFKEIQAANKYYKIRI